MKGLIKIIRSVIESKTFSALMKISGIGLLACLAAFVILCFLGFFFIPPRYKCATRVFKNLFIRIKRVSKLYKYAVCLYVLCAAIAFWVNRFSLPEAGKQKTIYLQTELATQKEIELLFLQEFTDDDGWKESESLLKLHVEEGFINSAISKEMFDYYEELFSEIYKNGTKVELVKGADLKGEAKNYSSLENEYLKEADRWKSSYDLTQNSACLYQYGRALNDAAMTIRGVAFMDMLEIAADAIFIEELFLSFNDRNINGNEPIIMNVEDISFMNGKLYLHAAVSASAGGEEKEYENCLLVEAYTCIEQGLSQIDRQNDMYALLTYYLGNIGERMLWRIPKEDPLYQIIGNKVLKNYMEALELVEENPDFYVTEKNMQKNLKDGISTLNQLGF